MWPGALGELVLTPSIERLQRDGVPGRVGGHGSELGQPQERVREFGWMRMKVLTTDNPTFCLIRFASFSELTRPILKILDVSES